MIYFYFHIIQNTYDHFLETGFSPSTFLPLCNQQTTNQLKYEMKLGKYDNYCNNY